VTETLKSIGARLKRQKKHEVWELPNGKTFVRASTPSDACADNNNLADLRRVAGLADPDRGKPGQRRERRSKPGRMESKGHVHAAPVSDFAAKLSLSGAVEAGLRNEIAALTQKIADTEARHAAERCWWCRLKGWWIK
jgi:hypothetical protein